MKLSIIIPVYNEENTIQELLKRVAAVSLKKLKKEIIVVDDCSTDKTLQILRRHPNLTLIHHEQNQGKGAAVRSAIQQATGDIILIQDADLEYNPQDYKQLLTPILNKEAHVVYGSRRLTKNKKSTTLFTWGGILSTAVINLLYNAHLTDIATCYKVFEKDIIRNIPLNENGFSFDPEITIKLLKRNIKIREVPISYNPRSKIEGKKIRLYHGLSFFWVAFKHRWGNS